MFFCDFTMESYFKINATAFRKLSPSGCPKLQGWQVSWGFLVESKFFPLA